MAMNGRPNVLLVGHLEAAKLSTFLTEFFHPDRRTDVNQAAFYHVCMCVRGVCLSVCQRLSCVVLSFFLTRRPPFVWLAINNTTGGHFGQRGAER